MPPLSLSHGWWVHGGLGASTCYGRWPCGQGQQGHTLRGAGGGGQQQDRAIWVQLGPPAPPDSGPIVVTIVRDRDLLTTDTTSSGEVRPGWGQGRGRGVKTQGRKRRLKFISRPPPPRPKARSRRGRGDRLPRAPSQPVPICTLGRSPGATGSSEGARPHEASEASGPFRRP